KEKADQHLKTYQLIRIHNLYLLRRHIRPQREKTEVIESVVDGQQSLFSDDELAQLHDSNVSITEVIEKQTKQVVRHRKAKSSGQRTAFLDGLHQLDNTVDVNKVIFQYRKKTSVKEIANR